MSNVFQKIAAVQARLAKQGIAKDATNQAQRFKYRGIDAVMNTLGPILAEERLILLPVNTASEHWTVQTAKGATMNHWKVTVRFQFLDPDAEAEDFRAHCVEFPGEAFDSGDKGLAKATTAAFKYMLFQAFCIPIEGMEDADADSHEIAGAPQAQLMSEDQRHEILGKLMQSNSNIDDFLKYLGYEKLVEVPASMYEKAIKVLDAKIAKMSHEYETDQRAYQQTQEEEHRYGS